MWTLPPPFTDTSCLHLLEPAAAWSIIWFGGQPKGQVKKGSGESGHSRTAKSKFIQRSSSGSLSDRQNLHWSLERWRRSGPHLSLPSLSSGTALQHSASTWGEISTPLFILSFQWALLKSPNIYIAFKKKSLCVRRQSAKFTISWIEEKRRNMLLHRASVNNRTVKCVLVAKKILLFDYVHWWCATIKKINK